MSFHHLPRIFQPSEGQELVPSWHWKPCLDVLGTESMRAAWQGYFWSCRSCISCIESMNWCWWDGLRPRRKLLIQVWINWELFVRSCTTRHLWGHHLSTLCRVTSEVCSEYFPSAAFIVILLGSVWDKDSFQSFQTSRHHCCSQSRDSVANPNVF